MKKSPAILSACSAISLAGLVGGCASGGESSRQFSVAPGAYAQAFDATREVLLEMDFDLERVDAASGVITTTPHFSQGLLEPWDATQSSPGDEWEDAVNMQAREVRVTFAPPSAAQPPESQPLAESELTGAVRVTILRQQRAGRRLDSEWVGGSTFYVDEELKARAGSSYLVPLRRDERLEARLAKAIAARLAPPDQPAPPDEPSPPDEPPSTDEGS